MSMLSPRLWLLSSATWPLELQGPITPTGQKAPRSGSISHITLGQQKRSATGLPTLQALSCLHISECLSAERSIWPSQGMQDRGYQERVCRQCDEWTSMSFWIPFSVMPGRLWHLNLIKHRPHWVAVLPGILNHQCAGYNHWFLDPIPRYSKPIDLRRGPEICPKQPNNSRQVILRTVMLRSQSLRESCIWLLCLPEKIRFSQQ